MGPSNKTIYLPDDTTLKHQKSNASFWPTLEQSMRGRHTPRTQATPYEHMSVNKMAKEGYTTVFHPGKEGVTVHNLGTNKILTTDKLVLTGTNSNRLWLVKANENELKEKANHVYSIQSTEGKIRFLHMAVGFPTKETC
jgi:hypothetical protein